MTAVATPRVSLIFLILLNLFREPAGAAGRHRAQHHHRRGRRRHQQHPPGVNREPIVQVEDQNHKPDAGAVVIFFLPDQGASGAFPDGSHMLMTVTDNQGRAMARGIRPNNQSGPLQFA